MGQNKQSKYRVTFILDTRGYAEPVDTLIEKLKSIIGAVEGVVDQVKNLGVLDFARVTDRTLTAAHYLQVDFSAPRTAPVALREKLALDRTVNRMLVEAL